VKAREYIERKRARKGKASRPFLLNYPPETLGGSSGFIISGTTADIDTPEKREAIARQVMARTAEPGGRS
jgi:hypothetical protein